jgi:hypothetical protein
MQNLILLSAALVLFSADAAEAYMMVVKDDNDNVVCSGTVCTATARMACISSDKLSAMLEQHDVTLVPGEVGKDIVIKANLRWQSGHRLILDSFHSISIRRPITVAGGGGLTLTVDDGGKNGKLAIIDQGAVKFSKKTSSLIINGNTYTLVGNIKELASDVEQQPAGNFALANDFDAENNFHEAPSIPIVFSGTFEGLGHVIANLRIAHGTVFNDDGNSYWAAGLFGSIGPAGTVRDLALKNISAAVSHADAEIGAIAGHNEGLIRYVTASGSVAGEGAAVGGVAGYSSGTIYAAISEANVAAGRSKWAGGMVGANWGTIERSEAHGAVSGGMYVGGLAGLSKKTEISYATGSVTAGTDNSTIGGLAGKAGEIVESYATGPVTGTSDHVTAGGLAGRASSVKNSYATGTVQVGADGIGGGMVGYLAQGAIADSYSIGVVSGGPASILGSFVGHDEGGTVADYWNTDVGDQGCGEGDCEGVTGLSSDVLKAQLPPGFLSRAWGQDADHNDGYPYLLAPLKRFP